MTSERAPTRAILVVLCGMGIALFSDFLVTQDIECGQLVKLSPGQLEAQPLEMTAFYLTRNSGLRRLAVFLDLLIDVSATPA